MRALVYDGSAVRFRLAHPEPQLADDAVLLNPLIAGVCQTDFEIAKGYMKFTGVLGHEFVATVTKVGKSVDPQWLGKRVVGEINCVCGKCEMCSRGLSSHCFRRTVLGILSRDGAFADLLTLPSRNLHIVPDHLTNEQAVFTEPLAAAFQILRQIPIEKRSRVLILGDGRLGQLIAQVIHRTGCQAILVGRHEEKIELAERICGIRTTLERDLQPSRSHDIVIDATGRAEGLTRALEMVRPRGTIVLKTTIAADKPLNLAPIVIDEITLLGSRCGPFPQALAALAAGQINVLPLISRRIPLDQAESLFANAPTDSLKTLLTF